MVPTEKYQSTCGGSPNRYPTWAWAVTAFQATRKRASFSQHAYITRSAQTLAPHIIPSAICQIQPPPLPLLAAPLLLPPRCWGGQIHDHGIPIQWARQAEAGRPREAPVGAPAERRTRPRQSSPSTTARSSRRPTTARPAAERAAGDGQHHTLLQALLSWGPLSERNFPAVFAAISGKNPVRCPPASILLTPLAAQLLDEMLL
jgi:hypothetical protein